MYYLTNKAVRNINLLLLWNKYKKFFLCLFKTGLHGLILNFPQPKNLAYFSWLQEDHPSLGTPSDRTPLTCLAKVKYYIKIVSTTI